MMNEYDELKNKYDLLEKKFKKLNDQLNFIVKRSDKTMKTIFNENISMARSNKRMNIIMKQSDKQSKALLVANEEKSNQLKEQSKMASMGKMIENISHQMKQPLSLIMTSATAMELQKELNLLTDDEFDGFTKRITDSAEYLSETIDNFKNFFQDDKKRKELNLTQVIVQSKLLLDGKFKGSGIKIIHNLDDIIFLGVSKWLGGSTKGDRNG